MANPGPLAPLRASLVRRALLRMAVASALLCVWPAAGQKLESLPIDPALQRPPELKDHFLADRLPEKPTVAPAVTIALDPLDFAAPNPVYIGHRYSMVSLDFLDDDHLLFTFRVPGLIRRTPGAQEDDAEHRIRAVVLGLPSGKVQAEALWLLHDRSRYIWPLKDGRFLFRDRNLLFESDAELQLKPFLSFPGPLLTIETDPEEQYLLTNSREPVAKAAKASNPDAGDDDQETSTAPDLVMRILRLDSGQVAGVNRVRTVRHLAFNSKGYLDSLQGVNDRWLVQLSDFKGGSRDLGSVFSLCQPKLEFISETELLATTCKTDGGYGMIAMTTGGQMLWQDSTSGYTVWPIVRRSSSGLRVLRESLAVTREIGTFWSLDSQIIKAQRLRVLNAATGNVAFEATADPVLDAGGNAAISPSGRRVAILSKGAIEVFNLPPPPDLPSVHSAAAP